MATITNDVAFLKARLKGLGVTVYTRNGMTVVRTATRRTPQKQSLKQFKHRQRVRHAIALWNAFPLWAKPHMFSPDRKIAYNVFVRCNTPLDHVYLTRRHSMHGCALLLPGMYVSQGTLPPVQYRFERLDDGHRILLTNLRTGIDESVTRPLAATTECDWYNLLVKGRRNPDLRPGTVLSVYAITQQKDLDGPRLSVTRHEVPLLREDHPAKGFDGLTFYTHKGFLALYGVDDEDGGWAVSLYRQDKGDASPQTVATTCTLYRRYTTDRALRAAVKSFGNIEDSAPNTSPDPSL